jgi:hypothetical protein
MELKNINLILKELDSFLKKDSEYRGYKIIDTHSLTPREKGLNFVLLLFFRTEDEEKLKLYFHRGCEVSKGEGLDPMEIYKFYGTMRMLRFS